jgi:curved DNA-binding protein CbpA
MLTYYELLDTPINADAKTVRRAYHRISKEFHPDRYYGKNLGPFKARLEEIFQRIKDAFAVLGDEDKAAAYGATLRGGGHSVGPSARWSTPTKSTPNHTK